jgi:hypothetical protein
MKTLALASCAILLAASPAAAQLVLPGGVQTPGGQPAAVQPVTLVNPNNGTPCFPGNTGCPGFSGGGSLSASASTNPTAVLAGPNLPLNMDLFSSLFTTMTDGNGAKINWSQFGATSDYGIAPTASSLAESCHVFKNSSGNLYGASGYIGAAGFIMIFNASSAPSDGAVTPKAWAYAPQAGSWSMSWQQTAPAYMSSGIVICASSTGPLTKTAYSTNTVFSAQFE